MLWQVENVSELTEEEIEAYEMASKYPHVFFLSFATLVDKLGIQRRPDLLNILQADMFTVYETMQHLRLPTRMIVLKSRQSGGSTGAALIVYHHCRRYRCRAAAIADIFANSNNIYTIARRYGDLDEFPWSTEFVSNSERATFSNGSMLEMLTAENPKAGISGTRQAIWKSEVAKWPEGGEKDAHDTNSHLMASLNKHGPNSLEIEESTPEGASGLFYEHYQGAVTLKEWLSGKRGNGMIKVFRAWHEHSEHAHDGQDGRPSVSPEEEKEILATLSDREQQGIAKYGWTVPQLAWRRMTLRTDCSGDETQMDIQYPEDDISCFAASGRPRFDSTGMNHVKLLTATLRPQYGLLTALGEGLTSIAWRQTEEKEGWAVIYEPPRAGYRYWVIVDPMTGAEATRGANPDGHSVIVWRAATLEADAEGAIVRKPMMQVARIKAWPDLCRFDNDRLAECIALLSKYYGGGQTGCMTVVERNKGELIIQLLRKYGIPLYRFEEVDKMTGAKTLYYGWETNSDSRHRGVEQLAALIRETRVTAPQIVVDEHTYGECATFIVNKKGRAEARGSCHDDDVLNSMMAAATQESATLLVEQVRTRRGPADRDRWKRMR